MEKITHISVDKESPYYSKESDIIAVYFNGILLDNYCEADSDEGWVEVYDQDLKGNLIMENATTPRIIRVSGRVRLEKKKQAA